MTRLARGVRRPVVLIPLALVFVALGLSFGGQAAAEEGHGSGTTESTAPPREAVPHAGVRADASSGANNLHVQARTVTENSTDPGRELYVQGCSTCHGVNGEGSDIAPSVIGSGEAGVQFYVGTGRMPLNNPMKQAPRRDPIYTPEQVDQLAKYVATLGEGPADPVVEPEEGNLVEGNQLYANNCASCHNLNGSGGALGREYYAPNLFDASPQEVAQAVRIGPGSMPVFNDETITPEQLNSLVAYVDYLKNAENPGGLSLGRVGPVSEGFVAWVVGVGALLGLARWIGTRE